MKEKQYSHISVEQRYKIEALIKAGHKTGFIADELGLHRSTIYREVSRNKKERSSYRAIVANEYAQERKERFSLNRKFTPSIKKFIDHNLSQFQWSPEQIHGYCKQNNIPMVSHERIYQYIYEDKQNGGTLYKNLRIASKPYRKRYGKYDRRGQIPGRVSIDQRPDEVDQKVRFGDWEADTIVGKNSKGAILTIVERKSKFTLMANLHRKSAAILKKEMINLLAPFKPLVHTITSDNGSEFCEHSKIAKKLDTSFFFAHPYSAWERGVNENTNGLIRQYIPKKSSFDKIDDKYINMIMNKLNNRPRKSLGFKTPIKILMNNFD